MIEIHKSTYWFLVGSIVVATACNIAQVVVNRCMFLEWQRSHQQVLQMLDLNVFGSFRSDQGL